MDARAWTADAPLAWRAGQPLTRERFCQDLQRLLPALRGSGDLVNLCEDRYRFLLALVAGSLSRRTTLLPPSAQASAVKDVQRDRGHAATVLDDACVQQWLDAADEVDATAPNADLDPAFVAAVAFTSGSSGQPRPHHKTWKALLGAARISAERVIGETSGHLLATVPSQHMYGLELALCLPLAGPCSIDTRRPLFPADIAAALAQLPEPRFLVTTPVHLRALLKSGLDLPRLRGIVSASAPLETELAARAEARFGCAVREILGATECGSIASRRTVEGPAWRLHRGLSLHQRDGRSCVRGEHLADEVPLEDTLLALGGDRFELVGRNSDLIKRAGKRESLQNLTRRLSALPGVIEAAVFLPSTAPDVRPAALVVAGEVDWSALLASFAGQVDPVFMPNPIRRVARLPRNALGKLPVQALIKALEQADAT